MRGTAELSRVDLRHNVLGHTLRLQTHHVLELLDELRVARDLEASHQVRVHAIGLPVAHRSVAPQQIDDLLIEGDLLLALLVLAQDANGRMSLR